LYEVNITQSVEIVKHQKQTGVQIVLNPEAEFMNAQISLRFLGILLRVLRLEVSVYNVYITNQFQTTFAQEGMGVKSDSRGDCQ
jgi:hypothetical protein